MTLQNQLWQFFDAHPDRYFSGEKLAQDFGYSRTAIWKAIQQLKKAGVTIESHPQQGYRYQRNDVLSQALIQAALPASLQSLPLTVLASAPSTNQLAKTAAVQQATTPQVFLADEQTAGYGRYGRGFQSPAHSGIYLSLLLAPMQDLSQVGLLTTATATAVMRAIRKATGIQVAIKWVNDLYLNHKKVCGILSEAVSDMETQQITSLVVGIGIDFYLPNTSLPLELQAKVGSLFQTTPTITRNQLIAAILTEFFALYPTYPNGAFLNEYRAHSFLIGRRVTLQIGDRTIEGEVTDIDDHGQLCLATPTGPLTLNAGEVTKVHF